MDKVQKIRKEIEKLHGNPYYMMAVKDVLEILDMQEEPKFKTGDRIKPVDSCLGSPRTIVDICNSWYVTDQGTLDFEYEDNWEAVEEPVSEDLEEASKKWLIPKLDKSYAIYGEAKMMELTRFDGYAMLDAIEFGAKWGRNQAIAEIQAQSMALAHGCSKESVNDDLEEASKNYALNNTPWDDCKDEIQESFKAGANWQKAKDESTTEDLGEYINKLSKQFPEVSFAKLSRIAVRVAKWQKEHLWKPADGDELPEIDREVVALLDNGKVVYAHRPPEYWDGKDIVTDKVTRNYPKTYDKGGWNIPNIKCWLDVELPK